MKEKSTINKAFIIKKIQPYLNDKGMIGEGDFNEVFSILNRQQQYQIVEMLIEEGIEIDYDQPKLAPQKVIEHKVKEPPKIEGIKPPPLTPMSNEQLCALHQKGHPGAVGQLVEKNIKVIWSRAKKYGVRYRHKLEEEDLVAYGIIGMMKAADRYKIDGEANFITYALYWIDNVIIRSIADYGFTIRVPVHYFEQINKLRNRMYRYAGYSREQLFKLYEEEGMTRAKFEELVSIADKVLVPASLNVFVGEGEESELGDFIEDKEAPSVEELVIKQCVKEEIRDVLQDFTERERRVIELRYGLTGERPKTLEEVGKSFNVTRERARQIEAKALTKLRRRARIRALRDCANQ